MTWYQLSKCSAIEKDWYKNFCHHLENNAQLLMFSNPDFQHMPTVNNNPYSSGIDGDRIFWSFQTRYKNQLFSAHVKFEFSRPDSSQQLLTNAKWTNGRLLSFDTNAELIKAEYFVIWQDPNVKPKRRKLNNWFRISQQFFLPKNLSPFQLVSNIKKDIIEFTDDDNDDQQPDTAPTPQPPSLKLQLPKTERQKKIPSLSYP